MLQRIGNLIRRDVEDLRMKKATAALNESAAGLVRETGGSRDPLDRLHQMGRDARDEAAARSRLARERIGALDLLVFTDGGLGAPAPAKPV